MSSRIYPMYRKGNPQLRVFLPNFWMKLVQLEHVTLPPNKVTFIVSSEMTNYDVRNYLKKIYNVPAMEVKTIMNTGQAHMQDKLQIMYKEKDFKVAYVTLPKDFKFEFPDVVKQNFEKQNEKADDEMEQARKSFDKQVKTHKQPGRKGLPSFFGL